MRDVHLETRPGRSFFSQAGSFPSKKCEKAGYSFNWIKFSLMDKQITA